MVEKDSVSSLNSHLGYRMRVVSNAVSQAFSRKLDVMGVTVAEWVVLREMYSQNQIISSSEVAQMTGLTRGAVSKLMDRLLSKSLILRSESSADRRYQEIKLTAKALKLVPKLACIADENDENFFSILSEVEQKQLMKLLIKVAEHHRMNTQAIE